MKHELPELPYELDALEPHVSRETLEYHYGKHHKAYVEKLNDLVEEGPFRDSSLDEIVREAPDGDLYNNAGQAWNHAFYWHCLGPDGGGEPSGSLTAALRSAFGSVGAFKERFSDVSTKLFGSGWTWLARDEKGALSIQALSDAGNPVRRGATPLLTCDMWEHAYYIDHRNAKEAYLEAFWKCVDWGFVEAGLAVPVGSLGGDRL